MNVSSILSSRRALLAITAAGLMGLGNMAAAQTAPQVKLSTSQGDIVLELYPAKAPKTVENFLQYVKDKHYDGTVFHRVMDGFMIQGGGFTADMTQKPTRAPVALETSGGLTNDRGTIAMARTKDPHSATSQFFINHSDNVFLDATSGNAGYAVFGRVLEGMEVVDNIANVHTWI